MIFFKAMIIILLLYALGWFFYYDLLSLMIMGTTLTLVETGVGQALFHQMQSSFIFALSGVVFYLLIYWLRVKKSLTTKEMIYLIIIYLVTLIIAFFGVRFYFLKLMALSPFSITAEPGFVLLVNELPLPQVGFLTMIIAPIVSLLFLFFSRQIKMKSEFIPRT